MSSDAVNRTFTALIICEKGNESSAGDDQSNKVLLPIYSTALFIPEGKQTHTHTASHHTHSKSPPVKLEGVVMNTTPTFSTSFVLIYRVSVCRTLQSYGAETEVAGHLCHHNQNPQGHSRENHRQLQ